MDEIKFRGPYIAGSRTAADWRALKPVLQNDASLWPSVFEDYFRTRLELRYLGPIKLLQEHGTFNGEGFSIVAIQCTLIEFLAATRSGLNYRFVHRRAPPLSPFEYSNSGDLFRKFLVTESPFAGEFDEDIAQDFYASVRCGLLHEACTKDGWTVWAAGRSVIDAKRRIVFRDNLQAAILNYVNEYGRVLITDLDLQAAFIRKFDSLAS